MNEKLIHQENSSVCACTYPPYSNPFRVILPSFRGNLRLSIGPWTEDAQLDASWLDAGPAPYTSEHSTNL